MDLVNKQQLYVHIIVEWWLPVHNFGLLLENDVDKLLMLERFTSTCDHQAVATHVRHQSQAAIEWGQYC